ncbi:MAG: hypothetical protein AAF737_06495 [Pseudomonadota bacterium]
MDDCKSVLKHQSATKKQAAWRGEKSTRHVSNATLDCIDWKKCNVEEVWFQIMTVNRASLDTAFQSNAQASQLGPRAEYIAEMLEQLRQLTSSDELGLLNYLLSIAQHEAETVAARALATPNKMPASAAEGDEDMVHQHTIDWWREQLDLLSGPSE